MKENLSIDWQTISSRRKIGVLANGYVVKIDIDQFGREYLVEISRSKGSKPLSFVPFLASRDSIHKGTLAERLARLFRPKRTHNGVALRQAVARIAKLPRASPGEIVRSWGDAPDRIIGGSAHALATADETKIREKYSYLEKIPVHDLFEAFKPTSGGRPWFENRNQRLDVARMARSGRIDSLIRGVREYGEHRDNPRLELADEAVERAALRYTHMQIQNDLSLTDGKWKEGQDLTWLIHANNRSSAANTATALYLGQLLIGKLPEGDLRDAAAVWAGASRNLYSLFVDPDDRKAHPEAWREMRRLAHGCIDNRTKYPVTVWHGFNSDSRKPLTTTPKGNVLKEHPSFSATSLTAVKAFEHAKTQQDHNAHLARIYLPEQSRALFIGGHEFEVLLPPGTRFVSTGNLSTATLSDPKGNNHDVTILDVEAKIPEKFIEPLETIT